MLRLRYMTATVMMLVIIWPLVTIGAIFGFTAQAFIWLNCELYPEAAEQWEVYEA
jgi:hypothetical protein